MRAVFYIWENGGLELVQVHGISDWWKPELSLGLSNSEELALYAYDLAPE